MLVPALRDAVGVVNLEGPVGVAPFAQTRDRSVRLANDAGAVRQLAQHGVGVVTIANNHMADRGDAGERRTRTTLAQAGLRVAGRGARTATVRLGGRTVVFAAHEVPSPDLRKPLRKAAQEADVLVVSLHVDARPSYLAAPSLRAAVEDAVAAGARVVVAHGTHTLGPVERRAPGVVIAWGLGNLLFSCDCTTETEGAVLRIVIDAARTHAQVMPIDAGLMGAAAVPTRDPKLMFDLLEAIGSSPLSRHGATASF